MQGIFMFALVDEIVNGFALVKVLKRLVENVTLIGALTALNFTIFVEKINFSCKIVSTYIILFVSLLKNYYAKQLFFIVKQVLHYT